MGLITSHNEIELFDGFLNVNAPKASCVRRKKACRAMVKKGMPIYVLFTVMALFFATACKAKMDRSETADQKAFPDQSESVRKSTKPLDRDSKYCEVQYYYQGKERFDHFCPFERCTREADYMIVQRAGASRYETPTMGIRIRVNRKIQPIIGENSFTATQDSRVLTPTIKHYKNDGIWLAEIIWKLDPGWKTVRIDQDLMGYFEKNELVRATARFQFDIQEGIIDWGRVIIAPRDERQPDDGLCPP
jgi:hypothetical protein